MYKSIGKFNRKNSNLADPSQKCEKSQIAWLWFKFHYDWEDFFLQFERSKVNIYNHKIVFNFIIILFYSYYGVEYRHAGVFYFSSKSAFVSNICNMPLVLTNA